MSKSEKRDDGLSKENVRYSEIISDIKLKNNQKNLIPKPIKHDHRDEFKNKIDILVQAGIKAATNNMKKEKEEL